MRLLQSSGNLQLPGRCCKMFKLQNAYVTILVLQNVYYEVIVTKCVSYDFGDNLFLDQDFSEEVFGLVKNQLFGAACK